MKYIDNTPSAGPLLASLRDIGYSFETAIEDILDNSITAKSVEIRVDFSWNDGEPWILFRDDGIGMSLDDLIIAMRPGSKNPIEERDFGDLGRFGLGLKTASFSQAKSLTVITSKDNKLCAAMTDLDEIIYGLNDGFKLALLDEKDITEIREIKSELKDFSNGNGTMVLWRKMDRVDDFDNKKNREVIFQEMITSSRAHVELTFHRYLSPLRGESTKKIKIFFNGDLLTASDPFNTFHDATRELPEKIVHLEGSQLMVQAYILPHHSKLDDVEYKKYAGSGGYLNNQGFYVYRNKRLIKKCTWFGLIPKQELTKLARVRLDIPNNLDRILKVNVMKSSIFLPKALKDQLKVVINQIEDAGQKVYRQRGVKVQEKIKEPLWTRVATSGKIKYTINKDHSILKEMAKKMTSENLSDVINLLNFVESSFPTQSLYVDAAKNPKELSNPSVDKVQLKEYVGLYMDQLIIKNGESQSNEAIKELLTIDPFSSNKIETIEILKEKGFHL